MVLGIWPFLTYKTSDDREHGHICLSCLIIMTTINQRNTEAEVSFNFDPTCDVIGDPVVNDIVFPFMHLQGYSNTVGIVLSGPKDIEIWRGWEEINSSSRLC